MVRIKTTTFGEMWINPRSVDMIHTRDTYPLTRIVLHSGASCFHADVDAPMEDVIKLINPPLRSFMTPTHGEV